MSHNSNTNLLEQAQEAIDIATEMSEYWTSTYFEKVLDAKMAQVIKHIDDNNLEDLNNVSLPALNDTIMESAQEMAKNAQDEMEADNAV